MTRPSPQPVDAGQLATLAAEVVRGDRFPVLATVDTTGQPRLRPVSPLRTEGFTIYIANMRSYHKTAEIEAEPRVELCYVSEAHDQVRITGRAEVVTDRPLLGHYLGSLDHPELVVYRVTPTRVRFMREWALEYHDVPFADAPAGGAR